MRDPLHSLCGTADPSPLAPDPAAAQAPSADSGPTVNMGIVAQQDQLVLGYVHVQHHDLSFLWRRYSAG